MSIWCAEKENNIFFLFFELFNFGIDKEEVEIVQLHPRHPSCLNLFGVYQGHLYWQDEHSLSSVNLTETRFSLDFLLLSVEAHVIKLVSSILRVLLYFLLFQNFIIMLLSLKNTFKLISIHKKKHLAF